MMHNPQLLRHVERHPYPLLFATVSGAHLYGFPSPDSDFDLRGVHLLPLEDVVGLKEGQETFEKTGFYDGLEIDLVTHDARKFFELMLKKNGYVMEQVLSPLVVHSSPEYEELKVLAQACLTRHHAHHYLGFASTQRRLFVKLTPPKIKPLLYLYRVLLTGIYLMQTGRVEANLAHLNEEFELPFLPELIERKVCGVEAEVLADADLQFHEVQYLKLRSRLAKEFSRSHLPERPTARHELNELLVRLRVRPLAMG